MFNTVMTRQEAEEVIYSIAFDKALNDCFNKQTAIWKKQQKFILLCSIQQLPSTIYQYTSINSFQSRET